MSKRNPDPDDSLKKAVHSGGRTKQSNRSISTDSRPRRTPGLRRREQEKKERNKDEEEETSGDCNDEQTLSDPDPRSNRGNPGAANRGPIIMPKARTAAALIQALAVAIAVLAVAALTIGTQYDSTITWLLPIGGVILIVGMFMEYAMDEVKKAKRA